MYALPGASTNGGMRMITHMFYEQGVFDSPSVIHFDTLFSWGENKFLRTVQSILLKIQFCFIIIFKRVDVVFVMTSSNWGFYDKIFYCLLARIAGAKAIINPVGGYFKDFYQKNRLHRLLVPILLKVPNAVVVGTNYWFQFFSSEFRIKQLVNIPNPVIIRHKELIRHTKGEKINVLYLARMDATKGIHEFAEVIETIANKNKQFHFLIAGTGPMLNDIKERLAAFIKSKQVEILGFVDENLKSELFKRSDIYILPTHFEVLPISILEAMSYSNVIIATDVGGIPDAVIDQENGYLVQVKSSHMIAEKLQILAKNPDLINNMAKKSFDRCKAHFELTSILKMHNQLFNSLTHKTEL